eukprot:257647_1
MVKFLQRIMSEIPPSWCPPHVSTSIYVFWIAMLLQTALVILFIIHCIKKLLQSEEIQRIFKILCILIYVLFITSCIGICIHIGQSVFCSTPNEWLITLYIGGLPYIFGLAVLYLLYLYRIKVTFHQTRFALSKWSFIWFWFGFILQTSFEPMWFFLYLFNLINGLDTNWNLVVLAYIASVIVNFIFNVLLLVVFMHNVFALIRSTCKIAEQQTSAAVKSDEMRSLHMLLYPAIRYMICALLTMVSSNVLTVLAIARSFFTVDTMTIYAFNLALIILDQLVNLYLLDLQFSFSDERYSKRCGKFHSCISRGIISRVAPNQFNQSISFATFTTKTETSQERTTNTTGTPTKELNEKAKPFGSVTNI